MSRMVRWLVAVAGIVIAAGAVVKVSAQVVLDRIVVRVGGRTITESDIRRAQRLKLVDAATTEDGARRGLENRWLCMSELQRAAPVAPPTDAQLAARRAEWEQSVGGAGAVPALLNEAGMTEDELRIWLQDDLRIRAYMQRQFGMLPEAERARATSDWMTRLRQRADLR